MATQLIIGEMPGFTFPRMLYPEKKIDRSGKKLQEYLSDRGVVWTEDLKAADVWIRKAELSFESPRSEADERERIKKTEGHPTLLLIHESHDSAPVAYRLSDPRFTFAVAPGERLKRIFHPLEWSDPRLDGWQKRADRACYIGRPTAERIEFFRGLVDQGVALDIYSETPWPFCWKGRAADAVETARQYRYRFVFESTLQFQCHSEKLFLSLLSGCVSFYIADPALNLPFLKGLHLKGTIEEWQNREDLAAPILEAMNRFLFTNAWEVYSFREYYDLLIRSAREIAGTQSSPADKFPSPITSASPPPLTQTLFDEGVSLLHQGRPLEAAERFEKLLEILGPIFFVFLHLGVARMRAGDLEKAERAFMEGQARYPYNHEVLVDLAVLRRKQNRQSEAIQILKQTLSIFPESPLAWRNLGRAHLELGQSAEALKAFERGLVFSPNDAAILDGVRAIQTLAGGQTNERG